ncbi:putative cytochrome P450 superfamily [Helianthus annuus]|nr:putative cytochrome P450 superfamily [Helianthus annuus]
MYYTYSIIIKLLLFKLFTLVRDQDPSSGQQSWVDHLTGLVGRAKAVARQFDEFLEGVIEEHVMKQGAAEAVPNKGKDFVDILLNVQKDGTTDFTFQRDTVKAVILV